MNDTDIQKIILGVKKAIIEDDAIHQPKILEEIYQHNKNMVKSIASIKEIVDRHDPIIRKAQELFDKYEVGTTLMKTASKWFWWIFLKIPIALGVLGAIIVGIIDIINIFKNK